MDIGIGTAILIIGLLWLFVIAPKRMLTIIGVLVAIGGAGVFYIDHLHWNKAGNAQYFCITDCAQ
jgi:hypothetical protein